MRMILFMVIIFLAACSSDAASSPTQAGSKAKSTQTDKTATTKSTMKLKIRMNDTTFTATFEDNSSAKALVEFLQQGEMTLDMHDYGSFEKVADLPKSFPRNDKQIDTDAGDIILYQGNSITIYYDKNSWNFTRLGKIDNVNKARLKQILGEGNATVTFSIK
ncbi:cyclophilin-like fold protein [Fibrobacter sp.]|uniref:cyclophilin-like fold protein n=1 Tax=Fibrobacter sp. TaxID=35828 RepID=UPI00386B120D